MWGEPDPPIRSWTVRQGIPLVILQQYDDTTVRVRHACTGGGRWAPGETHVIAPALQIKEGGHTFTIDDDGQPTVTPSILCPDCGLHGFVTDGIWRDC